MLLGQPAIVTKSFLYGIKKLMPGKPPFGSRYPQTGQSPQRQCPALLQLSSAGALDRLTERRGRPHVTSSSAESHLPEQGHHSPKENFQHLDPCLCFFQPGPRTSCPHSPPETPDREALGLVLLCSVSPACPLTPAGRTIPGG